MRSSTLMLLATLLCIGCADVQRSLDGNPKLVILNDKEGHIACDGGVLITQENQGKYAVRFRELNGGSIGVTDVHGVERVETRDLNDNVRDNFGLHLTDETGCAFAYMCWRCPYYKLRIELINAAGRCPCRASEQSVQSKFSVLARSTRGSV